MPARTTWPGLRPSSELPRQEISPSTTVPLWNGSIPVTARASVVFPAPLTPISATTVPAGTSRSTERRTVTARP